MKKLFLVAVAACTALLVSSCNAHEPVDGKAAYFAKKWVDAEGSAKQQVEAEIEVYCGNLKVKDYELFNIIFEYKRDSLLKLNAKAKAAYFAEKWVNAESSTKQQVEAEIEESRGNLKVKDYELFNQVFESKRDSLLKLKAKKKLDEIVDTVEGAFDETVKTIEALIK